MPVPLLHSTETSFTCYGFPVTFTLEITQESPKVGWLQVQDGWMSGGYSVTGITEEVGKSYVERIKKAALTIYQKTSAVRCMQVLETLVEDNPSRCITLANLEAAAQEALAESTPSSAPAGPSARRIVIVSETTREAPSKEELVARKRDDAARAASQCFLSRRVSSRPLEIFE